MIANEEEEQQNASSHPKRVSRRRAPIACTGCRRRKVRCDVARYGMPCSNCRLDDMNCEVASRKGYFKPPANSEHRGDGAQVPFAQEAKVTSPDSITRSVLLDFLSGSPGSEYGMSTLEPTEHEDTVQDQTQNQHQDQGHALLVEKDVGPEGIEDQLSQRLLETEGMAMDSLEWVTHEMPDLDDHVPYIKYSFIRSENFYILHAGDLCILEAAGCFSLPNRPALEEFMHEYFIHVHPALPIMDEMSFWKAFEDLVEMSPEGTTALILIQAMLFAACHCVSATTIRSLGFSTTKEARAEYYRKAKLLFDMSAEVTPSHTLAQVALLLSFWTPPGGQPTGSMPNTSWLVSAVHHARTHHAHLYQEWGNDNSIRLDKKLWKRIWWGCIIRDRALSLGLRRAPQITHDDFDFQNSEPLCWSDLYGDGEKPRMYDSEATMKLKKILPRLIHLCILLTDFQVFSQHFLGPSSISEGQCLQYLDEARKIKKTLCEWHEGKEGLFFGSADIDFQASAGSGPTPSAVFLHTHMIDMYYHSAAVSLLQYELLLVLMAFPIEDATYVVLRFSYTCNLLQELKAAASGFAKCLGRLVKPGLVRLLPIGTTAFLAMPLIQHLLDMGVSQERGEEPAEQKHKRLGSMIEAMRMLASKYDGVEWVNNLLKKTLQQNNLLADTTFGNDCPIRKVTSSQRDQFKLNSSAISHLRIAFTVEVSLNRSRFTQETDLPRCLAGLFKETPDISLWKEVVLEDGDQ